MGSSAVRPTGAPPSVVQEPQSAEYQRERKTLLAAGAAAPVASAPPSPLGYAIGAGVVGGIAAVMVGRPAWIGAILGAGVGYLYTRE